MKKNRKGKLIVIEGTDGEGKATQVKLLAGYLKKKGLRVKTIDFPQYGKKSAGMVEEYLSGKYGKPDNTNAYIASLFYACDRYDASFKIKNWLENGHIVISDRYVSSNIGHQGGKIKNKGKRRKYIRWLYDLEYNIFGIPKPNATFILKVLPKLSQKLASKKIDKKKIKKILSYMKVMKADIHEKDFRHLSSALDSYLELAEEFPEDFKVIECIEKGKLLPPKIIHQNIIKLLKIK